MKNSVAVKQDEILSFVTRQITEKGYPPTVREICKAVHLKSTSTVHGYLQRLQEQGIIKRDPTKPRAIKVLSGTGRWDRGLYTRRELVDIPIVGRIAAGQPLLAQENIEDTFPIPADFVGSGEAFMLIIKGDSMIEAGILDGDYVLVHRQQTASNGDIVAALLGEEATVKRFYKEKNHIRLQPENSLMEPILAIDVKVLGKVIGVFRKM